MYDDENIYEDKKRWCCFPDNEGDIWVYARCPKCGRFLKHGEIYANPLGDVKPKEWICKKHGEVDPFFMRG